MTRARGRPVQGSGVTADEVLKEALALLDESGGQGLTMRALATRLGVTPMSLYRHVGSRDELLRALSDQVYADVLAPTRSFDAKSSPGPAAVITSLLTRYHGAISKHPQLTLSIFSAPKAFAGVAREITDRLTALLGELTDQPRLWRDILVDHAHGSGLALVAARDDPRRVQAMERQYRKAVSCLLQQLTQQAP